MDIVWFLIFILIIVLSGIYVYIYLLKDWWEYRQARKEIFAFVKSYKRRCTGNSRFIVTVESLQNSFREHNSTVILNVWMDLISERVIEQDPKDNEWCIR